jgi:hypothetical protein
VLSSKPLKIEVSCEDAGTMLGVTTTGLGTYASEGHQDVSIYGEDQGAMITADGDRTPSQKAGAGEHCLR